MSSVVVAGDTSGSITISAPAISGTNTLTLPVATDTLVGKATTDTLTNKSIVATQLTGTVAAARLPAGSVLQVVSTDTGAVATGTTTLPQDDTIPQNTEGTQFMSLAITPISASSTLVIDVVTSSSNSGTSSMQLAVFRDATVNAIGASTGGTAAAGQMLNMKFSVSAAAVSTAATTFYLRIGGAAAGTITFNGSAGARYFGGVISSSIRIREVAA